MGKPLPQGVDGDVWPPAGDLANTVVSGVFGAVGPGIARVFYGLLNVLIWASINTALTTTAGSGSATVASGTGLSAGAAVSSVNVPAGTTIKTISGTAVTLAFPTISLAGIYASGVAAITNLPQTVDLVGATVTGPGWPAGTTVLSVSQAYVPAGPTGAPIPGSVVTSAAPTQSSNESGIPVGNTGNTRLLFALTASGVTAGTDNAAVFTGSGVEFVGTVELQRSVDGGNTWITHNQPGGAGTLASWNAGTPVSALFGETERGVAWRLNCPAYTSGTINYRLSASGQAALTLDVNALA